MAMAPPEAPTANAEARDGAGGVGVAAGGQHPPLGPSAAPSSHRSAGAVGGGGGHCAAGAVGPRAPLPRSCSAPRALPSVACLFFSFGERGLREMARETGPTAAGTAA